MDIDPHWSWGLIPIVIFTLGFLTLVHFFSWGAAIAITLIILASLGLAWELWSTRETEDTSESVDSHSQN